MLLYIRVFRGLCRSGTSAQDTPQKPWFEATLISVCVPQTETFWEMYRSMKTTITFYVRH